MITLKGITKTYVSESGNKVEALKNIMLTLPQYGIVFVVGKSGCGKTTLLNILGGMDSPTQGELYFVGKKIQLSDTKTADNYRAAKVGFVFQEYNLLPNDSVLKNVELASALCNNEIITPSEALEQIGLSEYKTHLPKELSGGQKQRVAIARALVKGSSILLADEPTGNLDSKTGKGIFELLKKVSKERLVVVVTHDRTAADEYADRVIEISDGEIVFDNGVNDDLTSFVEQESTVAHKRMHTTKKGLPVKVILRRGLANLAFQKGRSIMAMVLLFLSMTLLLTSQMFARFNSEYVLAETLKRKGFNQILLQQSYDTRPPITSDKLRINELTMDKLNGYNYERIYGNGVFVKTKADMERLGFKLCEGSTDLLKENSAYVTDFRIAELFRLEERPEDYNQWLGQEIEYYDYASASNLLIDGVILTDYDKYFDIELKPYTEEQQYLDVQLKKGLTDEEKSIGTMIETLHNLLFTSKEWYITNVRAGGVGLNSSRAELAHNITLRVSGVSSTYNNSFGISDKVNNCYTENGYFSVIDSGRGENFLPAIGNDFYISIDLYRIFFESDYQEMSAPKHLGKTVSFSLTDDTGDGRILAALHDMRLAGVYAQRDTIGDLRTGIAMSTEKSTDFRLLGLSGYTVLLNLDAINSGKLLNELRSKDAIVTVSPYSTFIYEKENIFMGFADMFAVFALILLVAAVLVVINVISYTLLNQKHEIGILRSMGVRTVDIAKIYLVKVAVIAVAVLLLSTIGVFIAAHFTNVVLCNMTVSGITWLYYDFWTFLISLAACLGLPLLAAALPLRKLAKMKPIDMVR